MKTEGKLRCSSKMEPLQLSNYSRMPYSKSNTMLPTFQRDLPVNLTLCIIKHVAVNTLVHMATANLKHILSIIKMKCANNYAQKEKTNEIKWIIAINHQCRVLTTQAKQILETFFFTVILETLTDKKIAILSLKQKKKRNTVTITMITFTSRFERTVEGNASWLGFPNHLGWLLPNFLSHVRNAKTKRSACVGVNVIFVY